ncbi:MAG TPA: acyl-CoA dehydrogenase family protein, partial [Gemmatimonadales bacterium]|nr:acyl-CoA dehydrogenase family protein [Gemmatimonadales bacterium]
MPHQARWREQQRPDAEAWTQAGRAGVLLPDLPEAYGGGGGTFAHAAVVLEELAHAGVHFGCGIQSIVAHYLLAYGSEEQKCGWLPRMAQGELVAAIAMSEPGAGSDLRSIQTTARRAGDQYVINGSKTFITNGALAGLVCLAVKTDPHASGVKGISLILVETKGLGGYRVGGSLDKIGMHGQDTCELFFDECQVPTANLLGDAEGKGFYQMMERLPYERLGVGVVAVATAEQAVAITTK